MTGQPHKNIVLIGGGHCHALVLRLWGMNPLPDTRITVINPGPTAPYSGMLPGFVAGHYARAELDIDLVKLAKFAGAELIDGAAIAIDRGAQTVAISGQTPITYDVCSVDIGITSEMPQMSGFSEHGTPAKPLGAFASRWDQYRATAQAPKIAVIGGGVAGAELAMAMAHALADLSPKVTLIDRSNVLTALGDTARRKMRAALAAQGVTILEDAAVDMLTESSVTLANGSEIESGFTVGAAGAKPHDWITDTGLALHKGYIIVDPTLASDDPKIFAVGDCAHLGFDPRPKAGVYAVRQAPVLFNNLRAAVSGGAMQAYKPQKDYLKLVSLGGKSALAEKFGLAWHGPLLWRLKNRIDRKFMRQFD
ncbi:pyridine nucleotide-disulfide oxidoreductase family protein [Yoonia tamlensis]|uniref:Pyridine nucleotide-disulfide oxidoreductase family protein n=1 Tax=Yoonia tamlensis TaxID=390270 RepID=A0A1I6FNV1_9RHOB|nr:FAD-dependent oxidoreductase [Yoonia tamlensis]SFR31619.1 pyridine nucleotide-disulfide oxidoreductase family protein [Yoonia tamlensis]